MAIGVRCSFQRRTTRKIIQELSEKRASKALCPHEPLRNLLILLNLQRPLGDLYPSPSEVEAKEKGSSAHYRRIDSA